MPQSVKRELVIPKSPESVWRALTDSAALAEWMYPNDFEPRVGYRFTFRVPPNPRAGFDGIVRCEVLECVPPNRLAYSWAGGAVTETRVSYRLEPAGEGTRLVFEHSGFEDEQAYKGAEYGWTRMLEQLGKVLATVPAQR